jgi:hypothetical protein
MSLLTSSRDYVVVGVFLLLVALISIPSLLQRRRDPVEPRERIVLCAISAVQADSIARSGHPLPVQEFVARGLLPDAYTLDHLRASFPFYTIREETSGRYELAFEPREPGSALWYTISDDGLVRVTMQSRAPERSDPPVTCSTTTGSQ